MLSRELSQAKKMIGRIEKARLPSDHLFSVRHLACHLSFEWLCERLNWAIGPQQAPEAPNEKFRVFRLGAGLAYRHKREQTNLAQPLRLRRL